MIYKTVLIYGPKRCGKSTNTTALANHFGTKEPAIDINYTKVVHVGHLHFSHEKPSLKTCEKFDVVIDAATALNEIGVT